MEYAKTIAMATDLLANGRAEDVVQMVDPLLEPIEDPTNASAGQIRLHALMARVQIVHRANVEAAFDLLDGFDDAGVRTDLAPTPRAEVTLWLGWAHALKNRHVHDDAQALTLLDEAKRLFGDIPSPSGRCWSLIGQARAYFSIDEYHLMRRMLDEAAVVHAKTHDEQAGRWLHDLSVPALRFQGAYEEASSHVDALFALADRWNDQRVRGHAYAHRAALRYDLGAAPDSIADAAETAVTLLRRLDGGSEYPLLAAYHAHIGACLRQEQWEDAASLLDDAADAMSGYPVGQAHVQTLQARLLLRQDRVAEAEDLLEDLFEHAHHLPHGLQRSHVALLRGDLLARHGDLDTARSWMRRASRNARETGHRGNQFRALLAHARTALQAGDLSAADDLLGQTEAYDDYFSVLPYALLRFSVMGDEARSRGRQDDARSAYAQALSAASLVGDTYRAARLQALLGDLGAPVPENGSDAAFAFRASDAEAAAPGGDHAVHEASAPYAASDAPAFETGIGRALSRASLSVDLVAEAWIQGVETLLPDRWIAVYRCTADGSWSAVHEHGSAPDRISPPDPSEADSHTGSVHWIRLCAHRSQRFFLAVAVDDPDDPAWTAARSRLSPWTPVVQLALDRALLRRQRPAPDATRPDLDASVPLDGFVSESPAMAAVAQQIRRIRMSHSPVLVTGESGTGKTLVGRAVHVTSERSDGPFRHVRCANLQQEPMEARLFGRVAPDGSLTPGAFHEADGGTLLIEEVDDLPLPLQSTLVRALDSHEVVPQGATTAHPVDVRVLTTTSSDLKAQMRDGRFREDLYYRLNVIPLRVPPLRDRRADLPLLVRHFLNTLGPDDMPSASITDRALDVLLRYDWPGNVRQLRNEIERALLFVSNEPAPTIDVDLLSDSIVDASTPAANAPLPALGDEDAAIFQKDCSLNDVLAQTEKRVIERVLRRFDGQVSASADVLGLTRQGLYKKMKRLDVDASAFQVDDEAAVAPQET